MVYFGSVCKVKSLEKNLADLFVSGKEVCCGEGSVENREGQNIPS